MSGSDRSRMTTSTGCCPTDQVEHFAAVVDPGDVVAFSLERADERERDVTLVLDDEHGTPHDA